VSIATAILIFGVLVVVVHATNVARRDAAVGRRVVAALSSLGARPVRLDERAVSRRLAGCYWLAMGHDLAVWFAVECAGARGNLTVFRASVDAGFGMDKHRRRWAVACFSTTRDAGQVLALREPFLPTDEYRDHEPDAARPGLRCGAPRRHPLVLLHAVHQTFEESGDTSIEARGHQIVLWRPLRHVVDDFVALARTAAELHDRIEAGGRAAYVASAARSQVGDGT
jgi:hypothetical protein